MFKIIIGRFTTQKFYRGAKLGTNPANFENGFTTQKFYRGAKLAQA